MADIMGDDANKSFEELKSGILNEHEGLLSAGRAMCFRLTGSIDDHLVQECVNETILDAIEKATRGQFDLGRGYRALLYRILRNKICDAVRKKKRLEKKETSADLSKVAAESLDTIQVELRAVADDCKSGLSEEFREVIDLKYHEGLNVKEIAGRLNIPEGTVRTRHWHAMQQLRECAGRRGYL